MSQVGVPDSFVHSMHHLHLHIITACFVRFSPIITACLVYFFSPCIVATTFLECLDFLNSKYQMPYITHKLAFVPRDTLQDLRRPSLGYTNLPCPKM